MKELNYWNNKENCLEESRKYKTIYELQRNSYGCYMGLKRNGWLYDVFSICERPMGYWNDKKLVLQEASKYQVKCDFKKGSGGAYNSAVKHGWMDEICELFFKNKIRRFNNNNIHCVYVYEIPNFKTCYVGRTINLHERDLSHRRSKKHKNGSETYDSLYKFCQEKGIDIPTPVVLENDLSPVDSLEREDYWLKKYKSDGWKCLNVAKTGKNSGSLGSVKKWTYDACKSVCENFTYKSEVKKFNYSCYYTCLKNNWFDDFGIKSKYSPSSIWKTQENSLKELNKHGNLKKLHDNNYSCYKVILDNNWFKQKDLKFDDLYSSYLELHDVRKVAKLYHTSYKKIKELFENNGVRLDGHKDKILSDEDIRNIINDINDGLSQNKCSQKYGIGKRRLKNICKKNGVII